MALKSIKRLAVKILGTDKQYFSIKDEDKNAIKEIVNYYNATHKMAFENNELLIKFMMYSLMKASVNNRGKSLKEIFRIIETEIINTDTELLKTFLNAEINLSIWDKKLKSIGTDIQENAFKDSKDDINKLTSEQRQSLLETLKKPYTDDEVYKIMQGWLADMIIGNKAKQDGTHPQDFTKEQINKLHENYSTYN